MCIAPSRKIYSLVSTVTEFLLFPSGKKSSGKPISATATDILLWSILVAVMDFLFGAISGTAEDFLLWSKLVAASDNLL